MTFGDENLRIRSEGIVGRRQPGEQKGRRRDREHEQDGEAETAQEVTPEGAVHSVCFGRIRAWLERRSASARGRGERVGAPEELRKLRRWLRIYDA